MGIFDSSDSLDSYDSGSSSPSYDITTTLDPGTGDISYGAPTDYSWLNSFLPTSDSGNSSDLFNALLSQNLGGGAQGMPMQTSTTDYLSSLLGSSGAPTGPTNDNRSVMSNSRLPAILAAQGSTNDQSSGALGAVGKWLKDYWDNPNDPKNQGQMKMGLAGLGFITSLLNRGKQANYKSPQDLRAMVAGNTNWTPAQQAQYNAFFATPSAHRVVASPVNTARAPFTGGEHTWFQQAIGGPAGSGPVGPLTRLAKGDGGGQSDGIRSLLSDGEYVMDSDVVSALGDGSNDAGARRLDAMREAIRAHKRAAPKNAIPPQAKMPMDYLNGGNHG